MQIYAFFPVVCICSPFFEKHCPAFYFFNIWNIQYPHADVFSRQTWTTGTIPVWECMSQLCCTGCRKNRPHGNAIGGERPKGARGNIRNAFPYEPFQRSLLPLSGRRVCRCPIPRVPLVTLALPWAMFLLPLRGVPFQLLLR